MFRLWLRGLILFILAMGLLLIVTVMVGRAAHGDMIAFTTNRNVANYDVYLWDVSFDYVRQLTYNGDINVVPSWSPNGEILAWSKVGFNPSFNAVDMGNFSEYSINNYLGGSSKSVWSPTGDRFLFVETSPNGKTILMVNVNTSEITDLTSSHNFSASSPSWSPDGTAFAYSYEDEWSANRIAVYRLIDGKSTSITNEESNYPSWSPDGSMIAYITQYEDSSKLTIISPDGILINTLNFSETLNEVQPVWSPDSNKLAFGRNATDVLVYDIASRELTDLTPDGFYDSTPAWSPDSTRLAVTESTDIRHLQGIGFTRVVIIHVATGNRTQVARPVPLSSDGGAVWRP